MKLDAPHRKKIADWVQQQRWDRVGVVVMSGASAEAVRIIRHATATTILVYDWQEPRLVSEVLSVPSYATDNVYAIRNDVELRHMMLASLQDGGDPIVLMMDTPPKTFAKVLESVGAALTRAKLAQMQHLDQWLNNMFDTQAQWQRVPTTTLYRLNRPCEGMPGIVVGAGPSLDKNIARLKRLKKRAVIVAVDTSFQPCLHAGCVPHMVASYDGAELVGRIITEGYKTLDPDERPILVAGHHANSSAYEKASRAVISVTHGDPIGRVLADRFSEKTIASGGSVGTIAVMVLAALGCDRIILVGMDCALGQNEQLHVSQSGANLAADSRSRRFEVPAWGGEGTVTTTPSYEGYGRWLEGEAKWLAAKGIEPINATEGGAHLDGWAECTLDELAAELPKQPKLQRRLLAAHDRAERISAL